ncbi:MAG: HD domain-containing protein [Promethearchaeota archaeon]|jgi:3'-5' exoribonuclease
MSELLKAKEILQKVKLAKTDLNFKSRLQVINHVKKYTRNERPYLNISFRDQSGELPNFVKWTNNEEEYQQEVKKFEIGNIIEIEGIYKIKFGTIDIKKYWVIDKAEVNLDEFVKPLEIDFEALFSKVQGVIVEIENIKLKELLEYIFSLEDIKKRYIESPSSIVHHHNYKYGNLEHTVGMINIFEQMVNYYERYTLLDIDLIYTGIILHDLGKIFEYDLNNDLPMKTVEGKLNGHLVLGDRFISDIVKNIDNFPKDLENKVRHLILSHHGKKEWDSVVEPQFDEAIILHYLDMLDSRFKLTH